MKPQKPKPLKRPSIFARIASLAVGLGMILWLSQVGRIVSGTPFLVCLAVVSLGAGAVMVVLTLFGVKAFAGKESFRRFNLSSLMLVTVPLAIYLAGFRFLLSRAPTDEFTPFVWVMLGVFAVLAMAVMTMLLASMAEALLWAASLPLLKRSPPKAP